MVENIRKDGFFMINISYGEMLAAISAGWIFTRAFFWIRNKKVSWKREIQLLFPYICLVVVARFTFFPFGKVDGQILPLVLDPDRVWPFRINLLPLVYLFDYPVFREAMLNFVGNVAMFVPLGVVWPAVFKELDTHGKVLAAGAGFSLFIEILQLPFFDRVSDIDDLLLNSLGFALGYGIYLAVKKLAGLLRSR